MLADAHIHLFRRGLTGGLAEGAELRGYLELAARHRIDRALVVAFEGVPETQGNSEEVLAVAAEHPWLFPTAYLDLAAPPPPGALTALVDRGFAGFSLYPSHESALLDGLTAGHRRELDEAGRVLSLNVPGEDLAPVAAFARALPRVTILLSHLGGDYGRPDRLPPGFGELVQLPNVLVKLSGLYALDPVYPHAGVADRVAATIDAVGPDRLVWGSDYAPVLSRLGEAEVFGVPDWLGERLSAAELRRVLHDTLAELLDGSGPLGAPRDGADSVRHDNFG
ncbi:amidohydrolase family protein [Agromyces soli]|uniref:Amidohydrolase n=2 Tax=Agromyces soli TaxID=659012 RepID=A0ABY4AYH4_9MICO|nr:amidohydrolase family protein [Agromyces soli]UOE27166.1 amidohydrolase [Agromyces soli]